MCTCWSLSSTRWNKPELRKWILKASSHHSHFAGYLISLSYNSNVKDDENKLIELQIKVDKLEALLADKNDENARQVLLGNASSRSSQNKIVRFSDDTEVNPRELENGQILHLQSRMMDGTYERKCI